MKTANPDLENKVVLVTGSSRGIGRGIAEVLLEEGARVALNGRNHDALEKTRAELSAGHADRVLAAAGDINNPDDLAAMQRVTLDNWGQMDGLVCNAAALKPGGASDTNSEDFAWFMEHNFLNTVRTVNHFLPLLAASHGSVVLIGSIAGLENVGAPAAYASAKAALAMYGTSMAGPLAARGMRINTIAPGNVLFSDGNWDRKQAADPEAVAAMLADKVPLGRFGTPQEIGAMAAFLLSDRAAFITGACIPVDGGQTRR